MDPTTHARMREHKTFPVTSRLAATALSWHSRTSYEDDRLSALTDNDNSSRMIFLCWSRRDARVPFLFRLERFALFFPFLSLSIILRLFFFLPLFFLQEVSANRYGHNVQCGLRPVSRTNRRRRKPFTRRASPAMMSTRLHGILVLFCLFFCFQGQP